MYKCEVMRTRVIVKHMTYIAHDWKTKKLTVLDETGIYRDTSFEVLKGYFNTPHDAVHTALARYSDIHPEDDYEVIELYKQYVEVLEKWLNMN